MSAPFTFKLVFRFARCAAVLLVGMAALSGCGKLPKPEEVLKSAEQAEPPAGPPEAVVREQAAPTPEQIVADFLALPSTQRNDAGLQSVAEQTAQLAGISELVLSGGGVTDAGAALLPKFTGLKRLDLSGARVTVKALEYAATLPALESLKFNAVPLEDPDLAALTASPALSELSLGGTSISDSSFESLAALEHLRILNVSGNDQVLGRAFTDLVKQQRFGGLTSLTADSSGFGYYGMFEIGALRSLEHLSVCRSFVGDDALQGLEKSTSLKRLHLNDNVITDAGMPSFKRLSQLEELWLGGNPAISDVGLKELRGLKQLKELRLDGTRCTPAGVKELKEKFLQTTKIYFGGQEL